MRSLLTAIALLGAAAGVASAGTGVAEEAPGQGGESTVPIAIGVHAGGGRFADSAEGSTANGYGAWVDAEVGVSVAPRLTVLAFGGYGHDTTTFNELTTDITFTHLLAGARLQYEVTPIAWVGVGVAYLHDHLSFDKTSTTGQVTPETDAKSSPALELRVGFDLARVGRLRFQAVASGIIYLPDSSGGFASSIATISLGAQFR